MYYKEGGIGMELHKKKKTKAKQTEYTQHLDFSYIECNVFL